MTDSVAARLVVEVCRQSGLSRDEVARRAGMARSVVAAIESGAREPGVGTLDRLMRAAGFELTVRDRRPIDVFRNARTLGEVLDFAESLPGESGESGESGGPGGPSGELRYPVIGRDRPA